MRLKWFFTSILNKIFEFDQILNLEVESLEEMYKYWKFWILKSVVIFEYSQNWFICATLHLQNGFRYTTIHSQYEHNGFRYTTIHSQYEHSGFRYTTIHSQYEQNGFICTTLLSQKRVYIYIQYNIHKIGYMHNAAFTKWVYM